MTQPQIYLSFDEATLILDWIVPGGGVGADD